MSSHVFLVSEWLPKEGCDQELWERFKKLRVYYNVACAAGKVMKSIATIKDPLIIDVRNLNKPSERLTRFLLEGEDIIQWALDSKVLIEHKRKGVNSENNQSLMYNFMNQCEVNLASKTKILLYSFVCLILTYYISVLAHEYSHATMAWIFGYKKSPFDILYGSWYLMPVSENVDYQAIFASNTPWHGGLIGIAGIGMTVILFFLTLFFLGRKWVKSRCFATIFFFWLGAINVMEMFTYVPNRVFIEGDITEFYRGFGISPFWIYIPGTVLVLWALYRFYSKEIHKLYALFRSKNYGIKRFLLYLTFWPLAITFIYWVMPKQYVTLSFLTNIVSILIVIYLAILADPTKERVLA